MIYCLVGRRRIPASWATPMLTHPLLQGRSRAHDALHEDSGVTDGQSGCTFGLWISDSWPGAGKRGGLEDPPPPHQDRRGPLGAGRIFLGLNLFSPALLRGSLHPLSQCPAPYHAHGRRLTPLSCSPALPTRSPFTHLSTMPCLSCAQILLQALLLKASPSRGVSNVHLPFKGFPMTMQ